MHNMHSACFLCFSNHLRKPSVIGMSYCLTKGVQFNLTSIKVYKLKGGYFGIPNGLYNENGMDKSVIQLFHSADGIRFDFVKMLIVPQMCCKNKMDGTVCLYLIPDLP